MFKGHKEAQDEHLFSQKLNKVKGVKSVRSKVFMGAGVVDGEGGNSERCLKWGGGGVGVIKESFKKYLKIGVGKGKSCLQGEGES